MAMGDPNYVCQVLTLREELHLTQVELARKAGLTRQAVNLIEREISVPSVVTALRLAEALGCTVPELFKKRDDTASIPVSLTLGGDFAQKRVRLAEVGGRWMALPASSSTCSEFGEADGDLLSRDGIHGVVKPFVNLEQLRNNLLIAGCDPALALIRDLWRRERSEGGLVRWLNRSSSAAVDALRKGEVHIAGVHFHDPQTLQQALNSLPMEVMVVRFARWEQGWMLQSGNPRHFKSVKSLLTPGLRLINRAEGAGSRLLLDDLLKESKISPNLVSDYSRIGSTHFACAEAISSGEADVAIGLRAVAESYKLDFKPIQEVGFDLIVPKDLLEFTPVARLLDLLQDQKLHRQLGRLAGYEISDTGRIQTQPQVKTIKPAGPLPSR